MAIQEIWNAKKLYEQEKQAAVHLQDFMYTHLVRYDCYHRAHTRIIILLSCASRAQLSTCPATGTLLESQNCHPSVFFAQLSTCPAPYLAHIWSHRTAMNVCLLHSCLLAQHCMLQMQMILLLADQVLGQHSAFPSRSMSFSRVPPAMHTSSVRCTQRCQSFIQPIN
jgi:hypothetical protein